MPLILDRVRAKPQSRATIKCCLCGNVDTACLISDSCPHTVCSTCAVDRQVVLMDSCLICNVASSYAPCAEFRCGFPGCSQTFENEDLAREHGDTCPVRLVRCRTCSQYCLENQCENHQCDLRVFSTATSPKNNSNKGSPLFMSPTKKQEQSTAENTDWSLIPLTAIRKMKKLNEGAQGAIWKCTIDGVAGTYAVKYMTIENDVESNEIYRRALRLTKLRNEHLIRYYTTWRNPLEKCVMIVMELYVEENLGFLIQSPSLRRIPEQTILSFGLQCGKALAYLHDVHKLVHCDVKPQNILMFDKQTRLVLTDLDSMQSSPFSSSGHEVEYAWSAPEFVKGQVVTTFADIWSLGVVLLVLASLPEFPSLKKGTEHVLLNDDAFSDEEQLHACLKKTLQARRYSDDFILLLKDMINHDPSKRPRAIAFSERVTEIMTSLLLES